MEHETEDEMDRERSLEKKRQAEPSWGGRRAASSAVQIGEVRGKWLMKMSEKGRRKT